MKKIFFLLFSCFFYIAGSAQKIHFVYLQSENGLPFYLKMSDKIYSSTTSGYIILSNLVDSTYVIYLGFPAAELKESKFNITVDGKDKGYLIKNTDNSLNLFDLQSLTVVKPQEQATGNVIYEARSDAFTTLLAKASGDPSLLFVPVVAKKDVAKNEEKKDIVSTGPEVSNIPEKIEDKVLIQDTVSLKQDVSKTPVSDKQKEKQENKQVPKVVTNTVDAAVNNTPDEEYKRSAVKKYSESSTSEGFGLVFFDSHESVIDTIRLLIPNPKITIRNEEPIAKEQSQFLEIKKDTTQEVPVTKPGIKTLQNQCKTTASDNDFFRLRKNMAAKESDEAMVEEAKKQFKSKCFSTEQIKNLSPLFLTSAGKYLFFDAAYMHVSDRDQFTTLQTQIKDEYYVKRFKALIGE